MKAWPENREVWGMTRRNFVGCTGAATLVGCTAFRRGRDSHEVGTQGFGGFAEVLAYARGRIGENARVLWRVAGGRPLDAWKDDDRVRIVGTGRPEGGVWRLETRGLCMEFMLRMEVMGPRASTPHPRPGRAWEPELRVGDARRLMLRMLAEGGVEVAALETDAGRPARTSPGRAICLVRGEEFVEGQRMGAAAAVAVREGRGIDEVLRDAAFRVRFARELALPG